jgi:hypothetical protein
MLVAAKTEMDRWLAEHPLVLGGCALALGAILLGFGLKDILTGTARTKWGGQVTGGTAQFYGIVRAAGGAICMLFGLYKLLEGLF